MVSPTNSASPKAVAQGGLIETVHRFYNRIDEERRKQPCGRFPEETEKLIRRLKEAITKELQNRGLSPQLHQDGIRLLETLNNELPPKSPPTALDGRLRETNRAMFTFLSAVAGERFSREADPLTRAARFFNESSLNQLITDSTDAVLKGKVEEIEARHQIVLFFRWLTNSSAGRMPNREIPAYLCAQEHYLGEKHSWARISRRFCPEKRREPDHRCGKACVDRIRLSASPLKSFVEKCKSISNPRMLSLSAIVNGEAFKKQEGMLVERFKNIPPPVSNFEDKRFKVWALYLEIARQRMGLTHTKPYLQLLGRFRPPETTSFDAEALCAISSGYFMLCKHDPIIAIDNGHEKERNEAKDALRVFIKWAFQCEFRGGPERTRGRKEKDRSQAYRWAQLKYVQGETWTQIARADCPDKKKPRHTCSKRCEDRIRARASKFKTTVLDS